MVTNNGTISTHFQCTYYIAQITQYFLTYFMAVSNGHHESKVNKKVSSTQSFSGIVFYSNKTKCYALCSNSLYISRAVSCFYETEFEIYSVFCQIFKGKTNIRLMIILFCTLDCGVH